MLKIYLHVIIIAKISHSGLLFKLVISGYKLPASTPEHLHARYHSNWQNRHSGKRPNFHSCLLAGCLDRRRAVHSPRASRYGEGRTARPHSRCRPCRCWMRRSRPLGVQAWRLVYIAPSPLYRHRDHCPPAKNPVLSLSTLYPWLPFRWWEVRTISQRSTKKGLGSVLWLRIVS